ncbi:hypothetical protein HMI01_00980 [Halolactibacillus miurensis]|uniref:DUF2975 domain-containing protein n=1 Tax=Halolactibacillus miurensis TaxID=306541 RepID=A0A1I6P591_9BACI|nr:MULTISPECIES: DUF2975 domain-containing protein [Halolactibacillus]GEM03110.1 hypothetical protein HMI01_00980 [Halolactibacillus miurensis]SFS35383.1 Protein of unknown function [Halolactibacillus miurensis]
MTYSTRLLKLALIVIGSPIVIFAGYLIYSLIAQPFNTSYDQLMYPIVIGMLLTAVPFFYALRRAYDLLKFIDRQQAFTPVAVTALKQIKQAAIAIAVIYTIIWPFVYGIAEIDDAPGLVLVGGLPIFFSMVIAIFAALLQKLLKQAIEIKQENDLTI